MSRLTAIKGRLAAATPWPWRVSRDSLDARANTVDVCDLVNDAWVVSPGPLKPWASDGDLIAHAPEDLDFLLKEVVSLRRALVDVSGLGILKTGEVAQKAIAEHDARVAGRKS